MHWTEPANAEDSHSELEKQLWDAANQLWANAVLKPSDWRGATETTRQGCPKGERGGAHQFSPIVLGLIFLRYADVRFQAVADEIGPATGRRKIGPADYHAKGVLYLPEEARFGHLLQLPEGGNIGQAVNDAMRAVEKENPDLADVLPKTYQILENRTLAELLKVMASIPMDKGSDTFGLIYEPGGASQTAREGSPKGERGGVNQYFLDRFAMSEGQKGGEWSGATWTTTASPEGWRGGANQFCSPTSIVRLIVEILEPYHGRIYDPACDSGGMFVQSARFVESHHRNQPPRPAQPCSPQSQRRHPPGKHLLRGSPRLARLVRYCGGESTLQRQQGDKDQTADDTRYPFGLTRPDNRVTFAA